MGPIQKTSQKPVPDHQRAEKSDNATFSGNLIHSGISKQHSNKSIDMSRAKLPQRFDWVMHNIRKVKTEEILEDDDDGVKGGDLSQPFIDGVGGDESQMAALF